MASFSGLVIGLSFVFGCVLLGVAAELYYLLWWKKKKQDLENQPSFSDLSSFALCWKTPNSSTLPNPQEKDLKIPETHVQKQDPEVGLELKDLGEESIDLELMRLHNLCGPPRFLFTINEETKEDLESERSRRGSRTRSLSDLLVTLDTPFLSPLSSPPLKLNLEAYHHHGLNPLFDPSEFDFNKLRSSPPPTFKFLRDAEEKLLRRLMQLEAEKRASVKKDEDSSTKTEEKDASFVKLVVSKGKDGGSQHQVSTPARVLPLASSPSAPN